MLRLRFIVFLSGCVIFTISIFSFFSSGINPQFIYTQEQKSSHAKIIQQHLETTQSKKLCPELLFKEQLKKPENRFTLDPIDSAADRKYMTFLWEGGLNNGLMELENAMIIAAELNRTLIIPYIHSEHVKSGPGSKNAIYSEFVPDVSRDHPNRVNESLQYTRVRYKNYSRQNNGDLQTMAMMAFRTYFRLKQLEEGDPVYIQDGVADRDVLVKKGKMELRITFMEDNPEFWASKTFYCPKFYTPERLNPFYKIPYFEWPGFKHVVEHDQFMCVGYTWLMDQPWNVPRDPFLTQTLPSHALQEVSYLLMNHQRLLPGGFIGIHNRRGDFASYCVGQDVSHCLPSYTRLVSFVKEVTDEPRHAEALRRVLDGMLSSYTPREKTVVFEEDGNSETIRLKEVFPVYVATNEDNKEMLETLTNDFEWVVMSMFCMEPGEGPCKTAPVYPYLRGTLDANILTMSGVFLENAHSTFSGRIRKTRNKLNMITLTI